MIAVNQYDKTGKFIAQYPSAREAERKTGANSRHISLCCYGQSYRTVGGYVWKFADDVDNKEK